MKTRIYYHHTDCGGVVYYANYLKFLEEARTECLEEKGLFIQKLVKEGTYFVVARQEIDYKFPAFYGDLLYSEAKVSSLGAAKIEFEQEIKNQKNKIVAKAKTILVCVDKDFKPKPIPEETRKLLSK